MNLYLLPVGTEDHTGKESALCIYPNPASDMITVHAAMPSDDPVTIQVIESCGKVIFTGRFTLANRNFEKQFDLSYLKPGI